MSASEIGASGVKRGRGGGRDDRERQGFHPTLPPITSHSTSAIVLLHRVYVPSPSTWPLSGLATLLPFQSPSLSIAVTDWAGLEN